MFSKNNIFNIIHTNLMRLLLLRKRAIYMKKPDRFFFICGILMFASEIWKQIILTFVLGHGQYNWWHFPFQLCSLAMYLCIILPLFSSTRARTAIYTFVMTYSLMGGIFVFFDTSGMHYPLAALTIHSYAWHIGLIGLGTAAGVCLLGQLSVQSMIDCTCIFGIGCLAATILNISLVRFGDINMFYISPYYKMSQVIFRDITPITGNGLGILFYILMVTAGGWLFFLIWYLPGKRFYLRHHRS